MGRFKEIDAEIQRMKYDGFDVVDIAEFLNMDVSDIDDSNDIDMQNLMNDATASAGLDADFYGNN